MAETANQDAPSPSAEAAALVMNWQEADFRAFAFYMCGFAPAEVLYFARSVDSDRRQPAVLTRTVVADQGVSGTKK